MRASLRCRMCVRNLSLRSMTCSHTTASPKSTIWPTLIPTTMKTALQGNAWQASTPACWQATRRVQPRLSTRSCNASRTPKTTARLQKRSLKPIFSTLPTNTRTLPIPWRFWTIWSTWIQAPGRWLLRARLLLATAIIRASTRCAIF